MFDLEILKGKNAFISGATGGIGKAIAIHLAKSGCNLFLTSTDDFSLEKLSKELLVHNVGISYISANISNKEEVYSVIDKAKKSLGSIDILINSAGVFPNSGLFEIQDKDYDDVMDINFRSAFIFMREFARDMVKGKWGRIVNVGSSSSYFGSQLFSLHY